MASVLNQMSAIFVIVLARLTLGEILGTRRTVGASLAFAGALVVLLT